MITLCKHVMNNLYDANSTNDKNRICKQCSSLQMQLNNVLEKKIKYRGYNQMYTSLISKSYLRDIANAYT